jgi:cytochrome c peroxidase
MRSLITLSIALLIAGYLNVAGVDAAEGVSIERGRELFESDKLGKSGKSCMTCHPGGKKLEWAGTFEYEKLEDMTNRCIQKALQGKPLKVGSDEIKSLIMYIKTFAEPGN